METDAPFDRPGVKTKLIGFILIVLGILDSLLTFRGGIPNEEYLWLIVFGAFVFAIGAARGRRQSPEIREKEHVSRN